MSQDGEKIRCPMCGRQVFAYIPKGGDGSGYRLSKHKWTATPGQVECEASRRLVVSDSQEPSGWRVVP